jgi:predicted nucleic acid-binding protein
MEAVLDRALEVQGLLAKRSRQRAVPLPDLIVVACAEAAGLTVLHYYVDYERIAQITNQPAAKSRRRSVRIRGAAPARRLSRRAWCRG